jgi:hypothetical protein
MALRRGDALVASVHPQELDRRLVVERPHVDHRRTRPGGRVAPGGGEDRAPRVAGSGEVREHRELPDVVEHEQASASPEQRPERLIESARRHPPEGRRNHGATIMDSRRNAITWRHAEHGAGDMIRAP